VINSERKGEADVKKSEREREKAIDRETLRKSEELQRERKRAI
jgi:hypothetical protein